VYYYIHAAILRALRQGDVQSRYLRSTPPLPLAAVDALRPPAVCLISVG